ncbi:MAG: MerR family DNA-binding protein [Terriglobales bacterium]
MPAPARSEGGRRAYPARALHRLEFIRHAQAFGFALADIRHLLEVREQGRPVCATVQALAQRELDRIEAQLAQLRTRRRELARTLASWQQPDQPVHSGEQICGLIEHSPPPHFQHQPSRTYGAPAAKM